MTIYTIDNYVFQQIIDSSTINNRIIEIAKQINKDYQNKEPLFLIVLTGGMFFGMELLKHIKLNCKYSAISAKSYGDAMISSGNVAIDMFNCNLINEDIILVDDIIDSGLTMTKIAERIKQQNVSSISIATLINKPDCNKSKVKLDYVGFNLGDEFLIGCGLDYKGYGRNLTGIYSL